MRRGDSLSDADSEWPRLELLVLVYGGLQWSSDWVPVVNFPKQINKSYLHVVVPLLYIPANSIGCGLV